MTRALVVVGAGGFGRETLDVVEAVNAAASSDVYKVVGVMDDAPSESNLSRLKARGVVHLGPLDSLSEFSDAEIVLAIGSPSARRAIDERLRAHGARVATLVHPSAVIGSAGTVGAGSIICGGVQVSTNVQLGRHVHLNPGATIGHDARIGDFVSVNPAAVVSGDCLLESSVLVGAGAVILQGRIVAEGAVIGAAACVTRDVSPRTTVKGVPAR